MTELILNRVTGDGWTAEVQHSWDNDNHHFQIRVSGISKSTMSHALRLLTDLYSKGRATRMRGDPELWVDKNHDTQQIKQGGYVRFTTQLVAGETKPYEAPKLYESLKTVSFTLNQAAIDFGRPVRLIDEMEEGNAAQVVQD